MIEETEFKRFDNLEILVGIYKMSRIDIKIKNYQ